MSAHVLMLNCTVRDCSIFSDSFHCSFNSLLKKCFCLSCCVLRKLELLSFSNLVYTCHNKTLKCLCIYFCLKVCLLKYVCELLEHITIISKILFNRLCLNFTSGKKDNSFLITASLWAAGVLQSIFEYYMGVRICTFPQYFKIFLTLRYEVCVFNNILLYSQVAFMFQLYVFSL